MTRFLAEATSARPHAVAVDDGERRWTFAELLDRSARAGAVLRDLGAGPGRTVVLEVDPSIEALVALHGVLHTGALLAPLHPDLAPPEREAALAALDPAVIVGPRGLPLEDLAAARSEPGPDSAPRDGTAPAAVLWTSGTSGKPRGILLSERGFRASAEATRTRLALTPDDVWYAALSPAHVGGLALLLRAALLGSGLALRGRYSVVELDALLDAGRITHVSLVPTMLLRLLERRHQRPAPRGLRCILVGGAHAPRPLVDRALTAGLPIALTYGLTEATSQVATASPDEVPSDPDGVGRPLDGLEVRISARGEILVRGPTVAPGLLGGGTLTDESGWLATGDLGRLDADGRLRVTGRRSDRIVSGGATVDAHEVEAVLRTHPSISDACVVGLADPTWGQRVTAAVVGVPGQEVDAEVLREWLRPRLSPAKRPRSIHTMAALPRNPNGKVDRPAVRRLVARAESRGRGEIGPGADAEDETDRLL